MAIPPWFSTQWAFPSKRFITFPALLSLNAVVNFAGKDLEILSSVVPPDAVSVVDGLVLLERPPEHPFCDQPVFIDAAYGGPNSYVAGLVNTPAPLPAVGEVSSELLITDSHASH